MAGLPVVKPACCAQPWLRLAWACLACLASNNSNSSGFATAGRRRRPVVVAGPGQGKAGRAGKAGPGQTKPRLGTTGKPAKPKQFFVVFIGELQISHVYINDICVVHIEECQDLDRYHEIWSASGPYGSVQAHILPEWIVQGLGSLWDTSRALKMLGKSKNRGIRGLEEIPPISHFPLLPRFGCCNIFSAYGSTRCRG